MALCACLSDSVERVQSEPNRDGIVDDQRSEEAQSEHGAVFQALADEQPAAGPQTESQVDDPTTEEQQPSNALLAIILRQLEAAERSQRAAEVRHDGQQRGTAARRHD